MLPNATTEGTTSACPWLWGDGVTRARGTVSLWGSAALALSGKESAVPRDAAPPGPRVWHSLAATAEPGPRGAGRASAADTFAGGIGFRLPQLSPAPWQPGAGLYFS